MAAFKSRQGFSTFRNGGQTKEFGTRMEQEIHEECGIFGVYGQVEAPVLTYQGLHALQHRGQEGAGIAAADGETVRCVKGRGLLTEAVTTTELHALTGQNSIGHVRYSTAGGNERENVQPIMARAIMGTLAVAHNGQIVNAAQLREELENKGSIFSGSSDSEIILHLIQREKGPLLQKIQKACRRLDGAFAFLILTEKNLYAIRDRHGLRPLSVAKRADGFCVSSESCSFDLVDADFWRDVQPGEILKFSAQGVSSSFYTQETEHRLCAMEYIYFARPDSNMDGCNVHTVRKETGRCLARKDAGVLHADMVVGVPDSSLSAAIGYSEESGLPYEMGLVKNRYVGRTFIEPTQPLRDMGVRMKLSANHTIVKDKRIVMIDDSLVRGTTSRRIVRMLKEAGAAEVHVRIASPAIVYPCFYGVDTSTPEELISGHLSESELCAYIGADSLRFLTVEDLKDVYGSDGFCFACFNGEYVTDLYGHRWEVEDE